MWLMSRDNSHYESRFPMYHFWLGVASVIHLVTIAVWVLFAERGDGKTVDQHCHG